MLTVEISYEVVKPIIMPGTNHMIHDIGEELEPAEAWDLSEYLACDMLDIFPKYLKLTRKLYDLSYIMTIDLVDSDGNIYAKRGELAPSELVELMADEKCHEGIAHMLRPSWKYICTL